MIRKASDTTHRKRYRMLIYGVPGIAKSTTALSAPAPLMVDVDRGWDRVPAQHRLGDYIQPQNYEEILADLVPETVKGYETIIIDTGGALLNIMKPWVIKQNPQNGQKDGITLSQRGYGAVGAEFVRLMDYLYYQLGKHVIVTFHAKEDTDGDVKCYRLDVEGQTRNNVWKPMDLGGFMEARGDRRFIQFSPTDRYFAKGTHGVEGAVELPNVMKPGVHNDFITNLFIRVDENIRSEAQYAERYRDLMKDIRFAVDGIKSAKDANLAYKKIKEAEHVFASKVESWHLLKAKAESCGMVFFKEGDVFVSSKPDAKKPEAKTEKGE